jgi:hypothetical protein
MDLIACGNNLDTWEIALELVQDPVPCPEYLYGVDSVQSDGFLH